jgi:GT2 family glycosyltransferase
MSRIGVVIIGRNEGERLKRCLRSVSGAGAAVMYVDSGSTDGSVAAAKEAGAEVVELDLSAPFTAGRARNAGFERLRAASGGVDLVQFVDGDCELTPGWMEQGAGELQRQPEAAIVAGRVRERFRDASPYNKLCDIEWNGPVGDVSAVGGIMMARVSALQDVGGFDPSLIAGEEPELCLRLRRKGWRIRRLDMDMTLHDAAQTRFGQWWKRMVRSGYAYAEGFALHGGSPDRYCAREVLSIRFWGLVVPLLALVPAGWTKGWSLVLLSGYVALAWRIARGQRAGGASPAEARLYAYFCVLGKFPQMVGQLKFWAGRLTGKRSKLIEYKGR